MEPAIIGAIGIGAMLVLVLLMGMSPGLAMLLTGLCVQIGAWSMMPVWYHLPFLVLLVPVTLLGASLVKPKRA